MSAYSVFALLHCVVLALRHVAPFALKGSRESRERESAVNSLSVKLTALINRDR